jgi:putative transcriptional regulator
MSAEDESSVEGQGEAILRIAPGTLLLSAPSLLDPNFMHSVVLMIQHDDDGAYGLVVNRPTDATLGELLPEHPALSTSDARIYGGGPVGLDTLQVLHRTPRVFPGGIAVGRGVFLGASLDDLVQRFEAAGPDAQRELRFVVGYSGWGAGQLDDELRSGSWVPRPLDPELVFSSDAPEVVWRKALRELGESGEGLASQPPDPSWN